MNLRILRPSRKELRSGDVFAMLPPDGEYLFGRVIRSDAIAGFGPNTAILMYVYRERSASKSNVPHLRREELLVPPIMTNRLGWVKGYFETVNHIPLAPGDTLAQHCFFDHLTGQYFEADGGVLPGPTPPVGQYGLDSYQTIDETISDALGIPTAPDEDDFPSATVIHRLVVPTQAIAMRIATDEGEKGHRVRIEREVDGSDLLVMVTDIGPDGVGEIHRREEALEEIAGRFGGQYEGRETAL